MPAEFKLVSRIHALFMSTYIVRFNLDKMNPASSEVDLFPCRTTPFRQERGKRGIAEEKNILKGIFTEAILNSISFNGQNSFSNISKDTFIISIP